MTQHGKGGLRRISTPHYESGLQEIQRRPEGFDQMMG